MNDYFIWNNVISLTKGIHVSEMPSRVIPMERESTVTIPGRGGTVTLLEGEDVYDDIVLTCKCWIENEGCIDSMIPWLKGNGKLQLASRPGGYWNARIANQISFDKILRGNPQKEFSVNFRCSPYFYLNSNTAVNITAKNTFVANPGNIFSEPVIKITMKSKGNADSVTIGTSVLSLTGVSGTVVIDTPLLECYQQTTLKNLNNTMTGEFPVIPQNGCYVTWGGDNISKISITGNWRNI